MSPSEQFLNLCTEGKIKEAQSLLKEGKIPSYAIATSLHKALSEGHVQLVEAILSDYKVQKNQEILDYFLREMIDENSVKGVELALKHGANVNHKYFSDTPLTKSCAYMYDKQAQTKIVQMLLNAGANVDFQDRYDQLTPLMLAVSSVSLNKEVVQLLLKSGPDLYLVNDQGLTALDLAQKNKFHEDELAQLFLTTHEGGEALSSAYQTAPLVQAVLAHNFALVQQMIESGEDINRADSNGKTALMGAVENHDTKMCTFLIENGADVNGVDNQGRSVLLQAVSTPQNLEICQHLFENEALEIDYKEPVLSTLIQSNISSSMSHLIQEFVHRAEAENQTKDWLHVPDSKGITPLMAALKKGNTRLAMQLLSLHEKDKNGNPIIPNEADVVFSAFERGGKFSQNKALLSLNEMNINAQDAQGNTALIKAAKMGDSEAVRSLLYQGADITLANNKGETLLTLEGLTPAVQSVIENYETPALIGAEEESIQMGSIQSYRHQYYNGPELFQAIRYGTAQQVEAILNDKSKGFEINTKDKYGKTPLMWAVQYNRMDILPTLLKYNPDIRLTDNKGQTAIEFASKTDNPALMQALLQYAHKCPETEGIQGIETQEGTNLQILLQSIKKRDLETFTKVLNQMPRTDIQNTQGEAAVSVLFQVASVVATQSYGRQDKETLLDMMTLLNEKKAGFYANFGDDSPLLVLSKSFGAENVDAQYLELLFQKAVSHGGFFQNKNIQDSQGNCPLHYLVDYAEKTNSTTMLHFLLEKGASLDIKNKAGLSVRDKLRISQNPKLRALADSKTSEIVIQGSSLTTIQDKPYQTALQTAIQEGNSGMIATLIGEALIPTKDMVWTEHLSGLNTHEAAFRSAHNENEGNTALHFLIKDGYYKETAQMLMKMDEKTALEFVNTPNESGITPFMLAVQAGDKRMVDLLLYHGADIRMANNKGQTASDLAKTSSMRSYLKEQIALIDSGQSVGKNASKSELVITAERDVSSKTDLFLQQLDLAFSAATNGNWDQYDELVEKTMHLYDPKESININAINPKTNETPLITAILMGDIGLVQEFLKDPRLDNEALKYQLNGKTAYDFALETENEAMIRLVTDAYQQKDSILLADPILAQNILLFAKEGNVQAILTEAQKRNLNIKNTKDSEGRTALHYLALHGKFDVINQLYSDVKQDIEIKELVARDNQSNSPLDLLAGKISKERLALVVKNSFFAELKKGTLADAYVISELIDHGGSYLLNEVDKKGTSALTHAIETGNLEMLDLLLKRGAVSFIKNGEKVSPEELVYNLIEKAEKSGDLSLLSTANKLQQYLETEGRELLAQSMEQSNPEGALAVLRPNAEQDLTTTASPSTRFITPFEQER